MKLLLLYIRAVCHIISSGKVWQIATITVCTTTVILGGFWFHLTLKYYSRQSSNCGKTRSVPL